MKDARKEYADIIDMEHHISKNHKPMDREKRAAQFAPFAALTGYDDLIRESERETDAHRELHEDAKAVLNVKLVRLLNEKDRSAAFTYFVPDGKKKGGKYVTTVGSISKYDEFYESLTLDCGAVIPIGDIIEIDCPDFNFGQQDTSVDPSLL